MSLRAWCSAVSIASKRRQNSADAAPSRGVAATGDDCTDPIVITAGPIPYFYGDYGQTTCGRGNNYSSTDLGSYDGGEDIIYTLVLGETTDVTIEMDPNGTTWTGLGLFTSCPGIGNSVATVTGSSGTTVKSINAVLDAGTYYIMVDTWPSPNCVTSFDLTVSTVAPPPPPDPPLPPDAPVSLPIAP